MTRSNENNAKKHAEVVNIEDLRVSECQHHYAAQLCERDAREDLDSA